VWRCDLDTRLRGHYTVEGDVGQARRVHSGDSLSDRCEREGGGRADRCSRGAHDASDCSTRDVARAQSNMYIHSCDRLPHEIL
jgi:hypothetical protein